MNGNNEENIFKLNLRCKINKLNNISRIFNYSVVIVFKQT